MDIETYGAPCPVCQNKMLSKKTNSSSGFNFDSCASCGFLDWTHHTVRCDAEQTKEERERIWVELLTRNGCRDLSELRAVQSKWPQEESESFFNYSGYSKGQLEKKCCPNPKALILHRPEENLLLPRDKAFELLEYIKKSNYMALPIDDDVFETMSDALEYINGLGYEGLELAVPGHDGVECHYYQVTYIQGQWRIEPDSAHFVEDPDLGVAIEKLRQKSIELAESRLKENDEFILHSPLELTVFDRVSVRTYGFDEHSTEVIIDAPVELLEAKSAEVEFIKSLALNIHNAKANLAYEHNKALKDTVEQILGV